MTSKSVLLILVGYLLLSCQKKHSIQTSGETKQWHKIELSFNGPESSEYARENPFLDDRLEVTFVHDDDLLIVPGFYAADGQASKTSADSGNQWKVRFCPDKVGDWNYSVSFRKGKDIAIIDDQNNDLNCEDFSNREYWCSTF